MAWSIFRLEVALNAKIDFLKRTNPWGAGEDEPKTKAGAPPMKDGELDREAVVARMEKALAFFG